MITTEKEKVTETQFSVVRTLVRRWIDVREDAEDIAQDVMVKLIRMPVHEAELARSWLAVVVRNACTDFMRKMTRKSKYENVSAFLSTTDMRDYENYTTFIPVDHRFQPEVQAMVSESMDALAELPEHHRTVLSLYGTGYSCAEIAELTSTCPATVRSRLHYARKRLNKLLEVSP